MGFFLVVLENIYLEEVVGSEFTIFFSTLEANPYVSKKFTQDIVSGLHLYSKDQVFIIHCKNYLTFQTWLLLIGGSSNFHCEMNSNPSRSCTVDNSFNHGPLTKGLGRLLKKKKLCKNIFLFFSIFFKKV